MHTYYNFIFSASPEMSVQSGKIPEECSFSLAANIRIFLCGVTDWTITVQIRADVKGYLWKKKDIENMIEMVRGLLIKIS